MWLPIQSMRVPPRKGSICSEETFPSPDPVPTLVARIHMSQQNRRHNVRLVYTGRVRELPGRVFFRRRLIAARMISVFAHHSVFFKQRYGESTIVAAVRSMPHSPSGSLRPHFAGGL